MSGVRKIQRTKIIALTELNQYRLTFVSNCSVCGQKISRFIKNQEANGTLGTMDGRKMPALGDIVISYIFFKSN